MNQHQAVWNEMIAKQIIQHLEKRRMEGSYAPSGAQARDEIVSMVPHRSSVYRCSSVTTSEIGLWDKINELPGVRVARPLSTRSFHGREHRNPPKRHDR